VTGGAGLCRGPGMHTYYVRQPFVFVKVTSMIIDFSIMETTDQDPMELATKTGDLANLQRDIYFWLL
jgi:hypothetical protein